MRMFNSEDKLAHAAADVPILLSAMGPKGDAVARSLEVDGLMAFAGAVPGMSEFPWSVLQVGGTVLDAGEDVDTERVQLAAGGAWAIMYHAAHDFQGGLDAVRAFPGGDAWADVIEQTPEETRHFAIHDGHLMYLNEADKVAWAAGGHALVPELTFTGDRERLRDQVQAFADQGVSELAILTSGPDIERELSAFADVVD